jgi:hypothetical protein
MSAPQPVVPPTSLAVAQLAAVQRAKNEWQTWPAVADASKASRAERIRLYRMDGCGWRTEEWCGAFVAFCYALAVHPKIRRHLFPSTLRLGLYATQRNDANLWPYRRVRLPSGEVLQLAEVRAQRGGGPLTMRGLDLQSVRPGDIVLVKEGIWGGHITLATAVLDGVIQTISGNTLGRGSDGKQRSVGVVTYRPDQIRAAIRPCLCDLDWSLEYLP